MSDLQINLKETSSCPEETLFKFSRITTLVNKAIPIQLLSSSRSEGSGIVTDQKFLSNSKRGQSHQTNLNWVCVYHCQAVCGDHK